MMLQQYSVTSFVCPVMLCTMPLSMQFCPTGGLSRQDGEHCQVINVRDVN